MIRICNLHVEAHIVQDPLIITTIKGHAVRLCAPQNQAIGRRSLVRAVQAVHGTWFTAANVETLFGTLSGEQANALQQLQERGCTDVDKTFADRFLQASIRIDGPEHGAFIVTGLPPGVTVVNGADQDWDLVLKGNGELATDETGRCVACGENRASICSVNCNHQCLCDKCARSLVRRVCPLCRVPMGQIVRPHLTL